MTDADPGTDLETAVEAALAARAEALADRPDPLVLSDRQLTRLMLAAAQPHLCAETAAGPAPEGMTIGGLREGLTFFTDLGGLHGQNMHESRKVLIRVHGRMFTLGQVSASCYAGSFVIILNGEPET